MGGDRRTWAAANASATWSNGVLCVAAAAAVACSYGNGDNSPKRPGGDAPVTNDAGDTSLPVIGRITNFVPTKARFVPGEVAQLIADVTSEADRAGVATLELTVTHLGLPVHSETKLVDVAANGSAVVVFDWLPPANDFTGYLAVVSSGSNVSTTAVDVSSDATHFPRYGFLSEFGPRSRDDSYRIVFRLAREYHLNMLQFYDWFWRHENLLKYENGQLADSWQDLFGRSISVPVLRETIAATDEVNTLAMAYVAVYAAREGYEQISGVSPSSGLFVTPFAAQQSGVALGDATLFLFNPADPLWQAHEIGQYTTAIDVLDFDGVHLDQFGPRFDLYDFRGSPVDVAQTFPAFLQATKQRLLENDPEKAVCAFNIVDGSVGGWGAEPVARSGSCDFLYSELWFLTNTYEDLRRYVEYLKAESGGKPVVLAGYAQYDEDVGPIQEAESAVAQQGLVPSEQYAGFTGTGYLAEFDQPGEFIRWDVSMPQQQRATLKFKYANATEETATRSVYVDDQRVGKLEFGPLGNWDEWSSDPFIRTVLPEGQHTVSLVYEADDRGVIHVDHLRLSQFSAAAIRLQNAAMMASGASPIQIGDDLEAIAHEYFPNRSKTLPENLTQPLRDYYKFMAAYENLLFDAVIAPVGDPLYRVALQGDQAIIQSGAGGIWTVLRALPGHDVLHLVNLIGVEDDLWRNAASEPIPQSDLRIRYFAPDIEQIDSIWVASPDLQNGRAELLEFTYGEDAEARYIEFVVPRLEYWDMVFMKRREAAATSAARRQ